MTEKYKELLKLAREAIKTELENKELKVEGDIKKKFSDKRACFVTLSLKKNDELRGCIGSLEARQELWKDVVENARDAAFLDPRFDKLSLDELEKIKIEISVLSVPVKISYKDEEDLKKKIKEKGVILRKGFYSATYLPQVWEQIKDEEEFLGSLCMKAGLSFDIWKKEKIDVWTYEVEKVKE